MRVPGEREGVDLFSAFPRGVAVSSMVLPVSLLTFFALKRCRCGRKDIGRKVYEFPQTSGVRQAEKDVRSTKHIYTLHTQRA